MRALVFFPEPNPHNDALRADLTARFTAKLPHGVSPCEMIDAHRHHSVEGWSDLKQVIRLYPDTFDCVVFAMQKAEAGKMLSKLEWGVQDLKKINPGLPLVGYVSDPTRSTSFNLMAAQIPVVVTEEDRVETLAMAVNVAVVARADGKRDLEVGPLCINVYTGDTFFGETRVPFTVMQSQIMKALARHQGEMMSRDTLMSMIYGDSDDTPDSNPLEVQISRMRKTLDNLDTGLENFSRVIQTARGAVGLVPYAPDLPGPRQGRAANTDDGVFFTASRDERALQMH